MFKFLQDKLVCPLCHGELKWAVLEESPTRIIKADISCISCGEEYSVRDQVVNFLINSKAEPDLWQTGEDNLERFFKLNPEIRARLMVAPFEEMSAADMYVKAMLLEKEGNEKEAEKLMNIATINAYTKEMLDATDKEFKYLINLLRKQSQFVVDIASGPGVLVKQILQNTDLKVVITDLSMSIIKRTYNSLIKEGYGERITFIAFDARTTPFRNNSVPIITSFVGLQNIDNPDNIISELKRISSGEFYSVCSFCSEDDDINRADLRKSGIESMYLKKKHVDEFVNNGWKVELLNPILAKSSPTPMSKILPNVGVDGFPVADGIFEHCIVKASVLL
jgi:ubiquinone/menaquinone biosynthesis C-methylase UbiE/uncharacterized protein YbaR (Trm112 family)